MTMLPLLLRVIPSWTKPLTISPRMALCGARTFSPWPLQPDHRRPRRADTVVSRLRAAINVDCPAGGVRAGRALARLMVCEPAPGILKMTLSALVVALAFRIACRSEPAPLSAVFVTTYAAPTPNDV